MSSPLQCPNLNHRRPDAPVRACPMCGEIVNTRVPARRCSAEEHTKKKRERNAYCVHCGERLIE